MFEAAIAMSRKWNATEAGEEIGKQIIEKMKNKPKFVLLFSTIHYEKLGGFQKFLDAVNAQLPKGTPVVGGTVAGFMNNYGCYTRGASALAVYSDEMDVAVGVGHNTKRNPKKAAEECVGMIKHTNTFQNSLTISTISNGTVPPLPLIGRNRVTRIPIPLLDSLFIKIFSLVNTSLQYGVGREVEVLDAFFKNSQDSDAIVVSSYDDNKSISNYQFFNTQVKENSICTLSVLSNLKTFSTTAYGIYSVGKSFKISEQGLFGCTFGQINGMPATKQVLKILNWPENYLDERIYRRTYYYPIGYKINETLYPHVMGLFIGNHICCTYPFKQTELEVLHTSGSRLIKDVETDLSTLPPKKNLCLGVACTSQLEFLGANLYKIQEKLTKSFGSVPFLVLFSAGEGLKSKNEPFKYFNESFNLVAVC